MAEMTFAELAALDVGSYMGQQFADTHVPLLEEVLAFAVEKKLHVKLDNKFEKFTPEQKEQFYGIVAQSGADAGFTCAKLESIGQVAERFPNATIHYDGAVDGDTLEAIKSQLKSNPLVTWLPLPSPLTSWVKVPVASEELCHLAKQYGRLGLWILETQEQLEEAKCLGADIIETTGALKP